MKYVTREKINNARSNILEHYDRGHGNADNRGPAVLFEENSDHLSIFRQGVETSNSRVAGGQRSGQRAISGGHRYETSR